MTILASAVRELREKTGAGMMDCKKALVETNGDFESAIDWLRTKGLSAAAKKSGRVASEGLTAIKTFENTGVAIEVNSETDFVSRNDIFQKLVRDILDVADGYNSVEDLKLAKTKLGSSVADAIIEGVASIGENINLRRVSSLTVENGVVCGYVHNAVADGIGTISTMVALESSGDKAKLMELAKQLAMHVAAAKPFYLNKQDVPLEMIEREKAIFVEQTKSSGRADEIIAKMVDGRMRKFFEEITLNEQIFVIDGKTKIDQVIIEAAKTVGAPVKLAGYVRFELGDGIEKVEKNFADEVADVVSKA